MTYLVDDTMDYDETKADEKAPRYQSIWFTPSIEILCQRPRRGIGVVRLDGRATPGCIAVCVDQHVAIASNDADHDGVVDKGTDYRAVSANC